MLRNIRIEILYTSRRHKNDCHHLLPLPLVPSYEQSWKLERDYFGGCNCAITCPCTFTEDRDEGGQDHGLANVIMVIPTWADLI